MAIGSDIEKLERRWQENPSGLMFAPLAEAYRKAGNQTRALEILELGLAVHPDYVPALIVQGRCHLDSSDLIAAETAFQQVLARDPMNPIALRGVADVYERSGRSGQSLERLELAMEIEPDQAAPGPVAMDEAVIADEPKASGGFEAVSLSFGTEDLSAEIENLPAETVNLSAEIENLAAEIENLSVDPMEGGHPLEAIPEPRLPWEPLPDLDTSFGKLTWTPAVEGDRSVTEPEIPPPSEPISLEQAGANLAEDVAPPVELFELLEGEVLDEVIPEVAAESAEVAPEPFWGESPAMPEISPPPESSEAAMVSWPEVEPETVEAPDQWGPMASAMEQEEQVGLPSASVAPVLEDEEPAIQAVPVMEAGRELEVPQAEPVLVVTESMAELFLKQGHRELALAVYRQLRDRDSALGHLEQVIASLEAELHPAVAAVAQKPSFAAAATGGRRVQDFLQQVLQSPPPLASASVLPPAIEPGVSGEPTRPMEQPLSLGAVFGDEVPVVPPRSDEEDGPATAAEPSYDEFFGAVPAGEPATAGGAPTRSAEAEDLQQFNEWLKGLKR